MDGVQAAVAAGCPASRSPTRTPASTTSAGRGWVGQLDLAELQSRGTARQQEAAVTSGTRPPCSPPPTPRSTSRRTRRSTTRCATWTGPSRSATPQIADSLPAVRALPDGGRRDRLPALRRADARLLRPPPASSSPSSPSPSGKPARPCGRPSASSTRSGEFGLVRTEPVLVVGGGLTTDVAGLRLRGLPPVHELHPGADHADRAHRRQRRDQGGGEPRQGPRTGWARSMPPSR